MKRSTFGQGLGYLSTRIARIGQDDWILTDFVLLANIQPSWFWDEDDYELAWNSSDCFESFSPLNNVVTEGVITTRSNRMKFRLDYEYELFSLPSIALAWTSVILAGKRDSRRHSTICGGNKLSKVSSFIILLPGDGLTSFSINNRTNLFGEKE